MRVTEQIREGELRIETQNETLKDEAMKQIQHEKVKFQAKDVACLLHANHNRGILQKKELNSKLEELRAVERGEKLELPEWAQLDMIKFLEDLNKKEGELKREQAKYMLEKSAWTPKTELVTYSMMTPGRIMQNFQTPEPAAVRRNLMDDLESEKEQKVPAKLPKLNIKKGGLEAKFEEMMRLQRHLDGSDLGTPKSQIRSQKVPKGRNGVDLGNFKSARVMSPSPGRSLVARMAQDRRDRANKQRERQEQIVK